MNIADLTPFHLTALLKFNGNRALTETSLAKALNSEKAVARHAINVLKNTGMIKNLGVYEFAITPDGTAKLVEKQLIRAEAKAETKPRKISTVSEAVGKMIANESEALKDIMNAPAQTVGVDVQAEAIVVQQFTPANDEATHHLLAESAKPELPALDLNAPADFDTLVRQGLARLNAQLGLAPVVIDRMELKIDTLGELAGVIGQVDTHLEDLLLAVVKDLQRIADRSS